MDISLTALLLAFYVAGVLVTLIESVKHYRRFILIRNRSSHDLLHLRPDIKRYLLKKPLLWPYFFLTEKGPLERLSELVFKHYGDAGHTYFGTRGLKNFLNDVFKGKDRYKHCQINALHWMVEKNSLCWMHYKELFNEQPFYATIIYTKIRDHYLLRVLWTKEYNAPLPVTISRFELDQAQLLDESGFKKALEEIS